MLEVTIAQGRPFMRFVCEMLWKPHSGSALVRHPSKTVPRAPGGKLWVSVPRVFAWRSEWDSIIGANCPGTRNLQTAVVWPLCSLQATCSPRLNSVFKSPRFQMSLVLCFFVVCLNCECFLKKTYLSPKERWLLHLLEKVTTFETELSFKNRNSSGS